MSFIIRYDLRRSVTCKDGEGAMRDSTDYLETQTGRVRHKNWETDGIREKGRKTSLLT